MAVGRGQQQLGRELNVQSQKVNVNEGEPASYFPGAEGRYALAGGGYRPAAESFNRQLTVYQSRPQLIEPLAEVNFIDYVGALHRLHKDGEIGGAVSWYKQIAKRRPPTT